MKFQGYKRLFRLTKANLRQGEASLSHVPPPEGMLFSSCPDG